ncbi:PilW family protein [Curvibacter sp. CHRR-16]|uniref:PilW family protein n=1 Tax=Curvibacter sp. CHRR-16 TaxID=2835872 RepID=UPI001BDA32EB|nr:PilW family protein [Curvibacter sp. CHRR-16]MBT0571731.1 PilW family protein [Curvibacter sp. CHRR-16]
MIQPPSTRSQQGFSLIELMVALAIGMILSLAMFAVLTTTEARKRTITSGNDMQQAGNLAQHVLESWIRGAGSGFSKAAAYSFGCPLMAYQSNTQILPATAALPAPFASVSEGTTGLFRLAPLVILPNQTTPSVSGQTSDVLVLMAGAAGTGGLPIMFNGQSAAASLSLVTTTGMQSNDLLLLTPLNYSSGTTSTSTTSGFASATTPNCLLTQVSSVISNSVTLDGSYHSSNLGLGSLTDNTSVNVIGNVNSNRPPQFLVIGVGDNNTLYSYDLLNTNGDSTRAAVARADGVFEMHALYGIDKDCSGTITSGEWVSPTDTTYSVANLLSGTEQEANNRPTSASDRLAVCASLTTGSDYLQKILAVRVGLIMRTSLPEKDTVSTGPITLFSDLGSSLTYTRTLKTDAQDATRLERHYRYQTVEFTIPLRNSLMLP